MVKLNLFGVAMDHKIAIDAQAVFCQDAFARTGCMQPP